MINRRPLLIKGETETSDMVPETFHLLNELLEVLDDTSSDLLVGYQFSVALDPDTGCLVLLIGLPNTIAHTERERLNLLEVLSIAHFIAQLPSFKLKKLAHTRDLQKLWEKLRFSSFLIAKCFVVACLSLEEDPLIEEEQNKTISKQDIELCRQAAYMLRSLRELLQIGFPYIKRCVLQLGHPFPFRSSSEFLCEIVGIGQDNLFMGYLAEGNYAVIMGEWLTFWEAAVEATPNPAQQETIQSKRRELQPFTWIELVIETCRYYSQKDSRLKARFRAFQTELSEFAQLQVDSVKTRTAKGKVRKSEIWIDGQRLAAGKRGVFSSTNPLNPS